MKSEKFSNISLNQDVEQNRLQIRIERENLHKLHMTPSQVEESAVLEKMARVTS